MLIYVYTVMWKNSSVELFKFKMHLLCNFIISNKYTEFRILIFKIAFSNKQWYFIDFSTSICSIS